MRIILSAILPLGPKSQAYLQAQIGRDRHIALIEQPVEARAQLDTVAYPVQAVEGVRP
jgi:hypothetical protein